VEAVLKKRVRVLKTEENRGLPDELRKAGLPEEILKTQHALILLETDPKTAERISELFGSLGGMAQIGKKGENGVALLLGGTKRQFEQLAKGSGLEEADAALEAVRNASKEEFSVPYPGGYLRFGRRPLVMGVLNVTPDSFFDGGRYSDFDSALKRGMELAEAGADIIDVGGESTRPGSEPVDVEEEKRRVVGVIEALVARLPEDVVVSVDTYKKEVAEAAINAGARMINDIYGLKKEPALAELAAQKGVPLLLMHIKGEPKTMQQNPTYKNLMAEIVDSLRDSIQTALQRGVSKDALIIDPGIGFGKSWDDNLKILNRLVQLRTFGLPVMVGVSRKSFIGGVLDEPDPEKRLFGTVGACAAALLRGACAFRVHDPNEVRQALLVAAAIRSENLHVAD